MAGLALAQLAQLLLAHPGGHGLGKGRIQLTAGTGVLSDGLLDALQGTRRPGLEARDHLEVHATGVPQSPGGMRADDRRQRLGRWWDMPEGDPGGVLGPDPRSRGEDCNAATPGPWGYG